jgi:hypothetical protein
MRRAAIVLGSVLVSVLTACGGGGGSGVAGGGGGGGGGGGALPWTIEVVDNTSADVGTYPSLALGPSNSLHLSYLDRTNKTYKYATWSGTSWTRRVVGPSIGSYSVSGMWSSVAVTSTGTPWVSFHVADVEYRLASWNGTSWTTTPIPAAETAYAFLGHNRVAVNPVDGTPRVSSWMYHSYAGTPPSVLAFWRPGLAAVVEVSGPMVASDLTFESNGYHNAIAVDSTGNSQISFVHWDGQPRATTKSYAAWAQQSGGTWTVRDIEEVGVPSTAQPYAENFTSIAVDASGRPHIVFANPIAGAYKYATWSGTAWTIERIDATATGGYRAEYLALDQSGTPHVCYYGAGYKLHYAKRTGANTWATEVVDPSSDDTGYGCGIVVDSTGKVHIAYRNLTTYAVKMAHR